MCIFDRRDMRVRIVDRTEEGKGGGREGRQILTSSKT